MIKAAIYCSKIIDMFMGRIYINWSTGKATPMEIEPAWGDRSLGIINSSKVQQSLSSNGQLYCDLDSKDSILEPLTANDKIYIANKLKQKPLQQFNKTQKDVLINPADNTLPSSQLAILVQNGYNIDPNSIICSDCIHGYQFKLTDKCVKTYEKK